MNEEKKKVKKNNIEIDDLTKKRLLKVQAVGLMNGYEVNTTSEKVKLALAVFEAVHSKVTPEVFYKLTGLNK